ncbi:hypothetical protein GCM10010149_44190 [Nonomuraea roseoviolacea subsp. roseoviolacea]
MPAVMTRRTTDALLVLALLVPSTLTAVAGAGSAHAAAQCRSTAITTSGVQAQWDVCLTGSPAPVASVEPPTCARRTIIGDEHRQCVIEGTYVLSKGTQTLKSGSFQAVNQQDDGTTVRPWPVSFACQGNGDYTLSARVRKLTYAGSAAAVDVTSRITATLC